MERENLKNEYESTEYVNECKCGKTHIIFAQRDNYPEYYTTVYIECNTNGCKELVKFDLPVN